MDFNPRLETKRLVLRKITKEDKNDLFELLTNSKIDRRMVWNHLTDMDEITQYIDEVVASYEKKEPSCFGIELIESGKLIGIIKFLNYKEEFHGLEVHYMLLPAHHNKGIMTEALIKVIAFVFKKTSINRIEAFCLKSNHAAGKVLEKAGMHLEGIMREKIYINGNYVDLKMFSIIKSDIQYI
ncbi:MAG: GNAT family N-acetyltransferase [Candidatus Cloacimonadales bacterium]|nr:GNAT family N-acetyltransferase [Candidatus Cloacimonadales bacterium]